MSIGRPTHLYGVVRIVFSERLLRTAQAERARLVTETRRPVLLREAWLKGDLGRG